MSGCKTLELRTWDTPYRGLLWIHTGLHVDLELDQAFGFSNLYRGGFIGSAILEDIVELDAQRWARWRDRHQDKGAYQPGLRAWALSEPVRFAEPIAASGKQGLYLPSPEQVRALNEANARARNHGVD
jgi:hypothetical protein